MWPYPHWPHRARTAKWKSDLSKTHNGLSIILNHRPGKYTPLLGACKPNFGSISSAATAAPPGSESGAPWGRMRHWWCLRDSARHSPAQGTVERRAKKANSYPLMYASKAWLNAAYTFSVNIRRLIEHTQSIGTKRLGRRLPKSADAHKG